MPGLKVLSGNDLLKAFTKIGFEIISQKGSHIKLRRISSLTKETLVIPNHKVIDKGTIKAIIKQTSGFITKEQIDNIFYNR